jgi:hypothetical protein
VPRPTPGAVVQATRAVEALTDPRNPELVTATADLIDKELKALVKALLESGRMQED